MLNADAPIIVHIRDGFTYRGSTVELQPTTANVLFTVAGQTDVALQSAFRGTVLAPTGARPLSNTGGASTSTPYRSALGQFKFNQ